MWYDQTKGLPDEILAKAIHEIGPGYDRRNVPMGDRAIVMWKGPKGQPNYEEGYVFAAPQAVRGMCIKPLMVWVNGVQRPYNVKEAGYIGEPGGYVPPNYPDSYKQTPLPNRLLAYIITPVQPVRPTPPAPGDLVVRPMYSV